MSEQIDGWTFRTYGSIVEATGNDGWTTCDIERGSLCVYGSEDACGYEMPLEVVEKLIQMWREKAKS